ncbi:MAG: hypothetical protein U5K75_08545 [Ahrensia sp.]|nr:hypothetical protein [Ahrensia sp.]
MSKGFKTYDHIGTLTGNAGSICSSHGYVTGDAAAAVQTSGYFNAVAHRIKTGDQLAVSMGLPGAPMLPLRHGQHKQRHYSRFGKRNGGNVSYCLARRAGTHSGAALFKI